MVGFGDGTTGNDDSGKGNNNEKNIRSNKMSKMKTNTTSERSPKSAFKSTSTLNFKSSSKSLLQEREGAIERIRNYVPPVFEKERRENNVIMKILLANVLFQVQSYRILIIHIYLLPSLTFESLKFGHY